MWVRWRRRTVTETAPNYLQMEGIGMAVSKAQQKAVNKYVRDNYDRVNVNMPKGKKDEIKTHAEARGESVNAFINRAIDETMGRDKK